MSNIKKYIVIGDVHGRTNWQKLVEPFDEDTMYIFVGDFTDPYYGWEAVTHEQMFEQIDKIFALKREHPNNFIILAANHDYQYIVNEGETNRFSYHDREKLHKIFADNSDLIDDVAYQIAEKYLITHAGVTKEWYEKWIGGVREDLTLQEICDQVNKLWREEKKAFSFRCNATRFSDCYGDSPKEFLYTTTTVNRSDYSNGVSLNFKHGNAKVYFTFESDDANTKLLDFTKYTPGTPAVPATPASKTALSEKRKMFDVMAEGEAVGYPLTSQQETMGGYYTGQLGNFMNLDPNHGSQNYITNERMAELMPLVNAQFIYVDEDGNDISNVDWVYGQNRKDKVFLKFAPGVNAADFIAGNDAFWTNLTPTEQAAMQNYHDSGCRLLRINQNANGDYFGWGESYGLYMNTTSRWLTILVPGTPGTPAVPATGIQGFILIAATSDLGNGTDAVVSTFAKTADATVAIGNTTVYEVKTTVDRFTYEIPTTALSTKTASPSVLFSLPVKSVADQGFTLKFSYVYKGDSVYDVRAYIPADKCVWQEGKKYKYNVKIQGLGNGKPDDADADENDPVVPGSTPIEIVNVTVTDYTDGDNYDILINH